jgi:Domain of unknown function (DUF4136)
MNVSPVLLFVAVASTGVGCVTAIDIHTLRAPTAHFEKYRTIAFDLSPAPPSDYTTSPRSVDVRDHVEKDAQTVLEGRGYALAPKDQADLVVRIEAGRREKKVLVSTGLSAPVGPSPGGVPSDISPSGGGSDLPAPSGVQIPYIGELDREEQDLVEGSFVIDAFDRATRKIVWHGSARAEVNPGPVDYERVRRAVESVLASFPAQGAQ